MNKLGVHALSGRHGWSHEQAHARDRADRRDRLRLHRGAVARPVLDRPRLSPAASSRRPASASPSRWASTSTPTSRAATRTRRTAARRCCSTPSRSAATAAATSIAGILLLGLRQVPRPADRPTASPAPATSCARWPRWRRGATSTLGLEVVNRYETNILNTAAQGVEMCRRIDAPNVKVHLDVYHMNIEESDIPLGDRRHRRPASATSTPATSHRGYMGSGSIDLAGVFRALVRVGYQGPITFESLLDPRRRPAARRHPRHLAQPLGGRLRPRHPRADVHQGPAQGRAGGAAPGRAQPAPGAGLPPGPAVSITPATTRPPSSRSTRSIRPASSGLCVAISAASPVSRTSPSSSSNTRPEVSGSRLPVGSSASSSARRVRQRPRHRHPLLLAARQLRRPVRQPRAPARPPRAAPAPAPPPPPRPTPAARCGSATFSSAENSGSRWWNW